MEICYIELLMGHKNFHSQELTSHCCMSNGELQLTVLASLVFVRYNVCLMLWKASWCRFSNYSYEAHSYCD